MTERAAEIADRLARRRRRLRGFRGHLIGYFVVMAVLVAINMILTPENPWFTWPMVAWGAPLAIHAAYAMELFGGTK
ncbi:MAG: 2TM domain-containing protein [Rhodospirillales bacterium]|nr:2TM domain-containing protein [Rhodospirillales bacterium]